ncbi:MAG: polyprenyl diphosphate synthase [Bdellovibrionales bacterium]|nr:polyprenyl diphosphate synthase [Bdellovibrionales bacterium]
MQSSSNNSLKHIAIIMDGNGRWACHRGHRRIFGHIRGARRAKEIVQICSEMEIPFLSLFAFSTENACRPKEEVKFLIKLFEKILVEQGSFLKALNARLHLLGDITFFSEKVRDCLSTLVSQSRGNTGLNLILALNYGGRQEIVQGMKKVMEEVQNGKISPKTIDENFIHQLFPSSVFPPPDLIIRTGGETRLSNFYLWSAAYSEIHFTKTLWPDFSKAHFTQAVQEFFTKERKFGSITKHSRIKHSRP